MSEPYEQGPSVAAAVSKKSSQDSLMPHSISEANY